MPRSLMAGGVTLRKYQMINPTHEGTERHQPLERRNYALCLPSENEAFRSPQTSIATRPIPKKGKFSGRGALVASFGDGPDRILRFESMLEMRILYILMAIPDIVHIWDQAPAIPYTAPDGRNRSHTPDFLVTYANGFRAAIAAKPMAFASRPAFQRELTCVRAALRKDYADDLWLITDCNFTRDEALNAERLHVFKKHMSSAAVNAVLKLLPTVSFPTTVSALVEQLGLGGMGFQALFPAFYDGRLRANLSDEITSETIVHQGDVL